MSMIGHWFQVATARRTNQEVLACPFKRSPSSCAPSVLTFPKWPSSFSLVVDNPVEFFASYFSFLRLSFFVVFFFPQGFFVWRKQEATSKEFSRAVLPPTFSLWVFCGSLVYLLCCFTHSLKTVTNTHNRSPLCTPMRNTKPFFPESNGIIAHHCCCCILLPPTDRPRTHVFSPHPIVFVVITAVVNIPKQYYNFVYHL